MLNSKELLDAVKKAKSAKDLDEFISEKCGNGAGYAEKCKYLAENSDINFNDSYIPKEQSFQDFIKADYFFGLTSLLARY